jgi:hypothetical protein
VYHTTYFSFSNSWLWWVNTAIDIILTPQAFPDVTTTDANREGGEWYPKTKFIANILKENSETKLVGINHKTLIADINNENDKTKLIGEGRRQYFKTKSAFMENAENYCDPVGVLLGDCLRSYGEIDIYVDMCFGCLNTAYNDIQAGTLCTDLYEVGFCDDFYTCYATNCHYNCKAELDNLMNCVITNHGCDGAQFWTECTMI